MFNAGPAWWPQAEVTQQIKVNRTTWVGSVCSTLQRSVTMTYSLDLVFCVWHVGLLNKIPTYLETTILKLTWWLGFLLSMILLSRQKGDQCGFSYIQVPCVVPTNFTYACMSLCICATWRPWNFLQLKEILGFQSGLRKMLLLKITLKYTAYCAEENFDLIFIAVVAIGGMGISNSSLLILVLYIWTS